MSASGVPRVGQKIGDVVSEGGNLIAKMSFWLQQYLKSVGRNPDAGVTTPTIGASPFVYTNATDFDQDVMVVGGTVSTVSFSRGGVFYPVATTSMVRLNPGDAFRVAYTVAPTFTVIPR